MATDGSPVDVLRYETDDGPVYRRIEAGRGEAVVRAHEDKLRKRRVSRYALVGTVALVCAGYGVLTASPVLGFGAAGVIVAAALAGGGPDPDEAVPELVERNVFPRDAEREYDLEDG